MIDEEKVVKALEKYWKVVQKGKNPALIDLIDLRDFIVKELNTNGD